MTEMTRCISPIDGSVYLERPVATAKEVEAALSAARVAQAGWSALSIAERAPYCTAIVANVLAMETDITSELAWQIGRPVRFGAGELRGFEERALHMVAIAGEARRHTVAYRLYHADAAEIISFETPTLKVA